jgi:signal transduction histidine kinase
MVIAELLENAVKYTETPPDSLTEQPPRIELCVDGSASMLVLSVRNRAHPSSESIARLFAQLSRIQQIGSAKEAYAQCMRDIFEGKVEEGGLGLARIICEAGCSLSADRGDGEHLEMRATFALTPSCTSGLDAIGAAP